MLDKPLAVIWITGPPASGKSTLCAALAHELERAVHIPVDDIRTWVVSGLADSVPWTDETERQFQLAESAVCETARCYFEGGFHVLIDHCRNLPRVEHLIQDRLANIPVVRICLMPDLQTNLHRSHSRTNKSFDPHMLDETIVWTNTHYREDKVPGWLVVDNSALTVDQTVGVVLEKLASGSF